MEEKLNQVINILDNFLHPIEFIKETGYELLVAIQNLSFDICLVAGFIALLLYVFGLINKNLIWISIQVTELIVFVFVIINIIKK